MRLLEYDFRQILEMQILALMATALKQMLGPSTGYQYKATSRFVLDIEAVLEICNEIANSKNVSINREKKVPVF